LCEIKRKPERKAKRKGDINMKCRKLAVVSLLFMLVFSNCQRAGIKAFSNIELRPTNGKGSVACKQTIESLLYEVWDSGFIRKNDLTKEEILNNVYGVFRKAPPFLSDPQGRAYYRHRGREKDMLILNANLFGHLELNLQQAHLDRTRIKRLDQDILPTLVHELFHDFWHNIIGGRERYLFTEEAEIFFIELMLAKTEQQKQQVLDEVGNGLLAEGDYDSFGVLVDIKNIYNLEKLGTELFAVMAGRAFSEEAVIPERFRKYYAPLISDEELDRGRSSISPNCHQNGKNHPAEISDDFDEIAKLWEENPNLINGPDKDGFTPLHHAAYAGDQDVVQFIIATGADLGGETPICAWSPLFLAALKGHREIAEELLKAGLSVDETDRRGRMPLHVAARSGHTEFLRFLQDHGAEVNTKDAVGMTPLHGAALCGRREAISFLLAAGADAQSKDYAGQTPLHLASFCGDKKSAELLKAGGAVIDEPDNRGETALHIAAFCGHQDIVRLLIERGAQVDIPNIYGQIPRETASSVGNEKIVSILAGTVY
jgi:ankyrin repeat protein